jgi:DNA polymerase III epsilon subunit family exonuclease
MSSTLRTMGCTSKGYVRSALARGATIWLLAFILTTFGADADAKAKVASRLPSPNNKIANVTFVAFDLETTGLSPSNDRIVEIGAVKFRNGKIIDQKSWLINPGRSIPWLVQQVHGITDEMVKDAPDFVTVYREFSEFIEGSVLMAHNARFDVSFLSAEIQRAGFPLPQNKVIDTLRLFRRWFPQSPSYSLADIVEYTAVEPGVFHRALEDSAYLFSIFQKGLSHRPEVAYLRDVFSEAGGTLTL